MKTIVCAEQTAKAGKFSGFGQALGEIGLPVGQNTSRSEDFVVQLFHKYLDNRFSCLRNTYLSNLNQTKTIILVGPVGVKLIQISELKGIFQAQDASLEELDDRSKKFKPVKPDPVVQCLESAGMLQYFLESKGLSEIKVEPVLIFIDPGAHVSTAHSALKIVLSDAIDRFAASLKPISIVLQADAVELIVDAVCQNLSPNGSTGQMQTLAAQEKKDVFSLVDETGARQKPSSQLKRFSIQEPDALKKVRFTSTQRAVLLGLLFLAITSLVLLVLVMVFMN